MYRNHTHLVSPRTKNYNKIKNKIRSSFLLVSLPPLIKLVICAAQTQKTSQSICIPAADTARITSNPGGNLWKIYYFNEIDINISQWVKSDRPTEECRLAGKSCGFSICDKQKKKKISVYSIPEEQRYVSGATRDTVFF